jgi:hypothetical protein
MAYDADAEFLELRNCMLLRTATVKLSPFASWDGSQDFTPAGPQPASVLAEV